MLWSTAAGQKPTNQPGIKLPTAAAWALQPPVGAGPLHRQQNQKHAKEGKQPRAQAPAPQHRPAVVPQQEVEYGQSLQQRDAFGEIPFGRRVFGFDVQALIHQALDCNTPQINSGRPQRNGVPPVGRHPVPHLIPPPFSQTLGPALPARQRSPPPSRSFHCPADGSAIHGKPGTGWAPVSAPNRTHPAEESAQL